MTRTTAVIVGATLSLLSLPGCASRHYGVIKSAVQDGQLPELASAKSYTFVYPEHRDHVLYRAIEAIPVTVDTDAGPKTCNFVLGQRQKDQQWEVVSGAVLDESGTWRNLRLAND